MQARNPGYVTINNRRAKVQKWQQLPGRIEISMLVHGYQSGLELVKQISEESISLTWDDSEPITVRPELTHHQLAGNGPSTVHRIESTFWLPDEVASQESIETRLDRIQVELRQLRAEIEELKSQRRPPSLQQSTSMRQRLDSGQTMIDAEIDIHDNDDE